MSPEIINNQGHNKMVDFWTFGCLIYEMLVGFPPFSLKTKNRMALYEAIQKGEFRLPAKLDESAKDLIKKLLIVDVEFVSLAEKKTRGTRTSGDQEP